MASVADDSGMGGDAERCLLPALGLGRSRLEGRTTGGSPRLGLASSGLLRIRCRAWLDRCRAWLDRCVADSFLLRLVWGGFGAPT